MFAGRRRKTQRDNETEMKTTGQDGSEPQEIKGSNQEDLEMKSREQEEEEGYKI